MRKLRLAAPALLVALAAACSSDPSAAPPACDTPVRTTSVTMGDFSYEPVCLQASNGTTVEVINEGDAPHTYTVEGTEVQSNLEPHDSGDLTFEGLTPGTVYEVTCIYHTNMVAALKAV